MAYKKPFTCTDVRIGDAMLSYKAQNKQIEPRRTGPASIADIDETGATAKFQAQTFKVERSCARKKVEAKEVEDSELDPMKVRLRSGGLDLGNQQELVDVEGDMDVDEGDGIGAASTGVPESDSGLKPDAIPAPGPPLPNGTAPLPKGLCRTTS